MESTSPANYSRYEADVAALVWKKAGFLAPAYTVVSLTLEGSAPNTQLILKLRDATGAEFKEAWELYDNRLPLVGGNADFVGMDILVWIDENYPGPGKNLPK